MCQRRKSTNPAPLGLLGLSLTTLVLSTFNAVLTSEGSNVVMSLAIFYGGQAQLLAGILEWMAGSTFGYTYDPLWEQSAVTVMVLVGPMTLHGAGLVPLTFGIFSIVMWFDAFRTNEHLHGVPPEMNNVLPPLQRRVSLETSQ